MNYNIKETDVAILDIGLGNADLKKLPFYEDLQKFGWIIISRLNGVINKVQLTFGDSEQALGYLTCTDIEPFLVLSDINMPKLSGMELREKIHNNEDLRTKSIPYLFFSTSAEQKHIIDAYSRSIQGFFVKPASYD